MSTIQEIGVVGAGQMGNGIAHVCALAGYRVTMLDSNPAALDHARSTIAHNLERQAAKGSLTPEDCEQTLGRITSSTDYAALEKVDLVIEAATEREDIKQSLYKTLAAHIGAETILATNTSSIPITRLAAGTDRPGLFIGLHFMNPPPVMALMEVIRGLATREDVFQTALALCRKLGKTPVLSGDSPGFILNRILIPMINEAVTALHEGVGTVEAIDTALMLGAAHKMGPLTLADFIGLDTCLAIMRTLHTGLGDDKYRPCPLLAHYVDAGWLGKKTGRGFYDYSQTPPKPAR